MSNLSIAQRNRALSSLNPHSLELILLPTEKCNFRCKYCYEDFAIGRMSQSVVSGIKSLIDERSHDLKHLHISWFGGEPLVAKDVVLEINRHARDCAVEAGFEFRSSITTNGYLLDTQTHRDLTALKVSHYQISIDGDQQHHDRSRPLASGKGTYSVIMANIHEMLTSNHEFTLTIRLHITSQNAASVENYYDAIRQTILKDNRVRLFVKAIANLGGPNIDTAVVPERTSATDVRNRILADYAEMRGGGERTSSDEIKICYAARPNSFVIRANGDVGKCTVAFNSMHNRVGHLSEDGSLGLDVHRLSKWLKGFEDFDLSALHCPAEKFKLF